MRLRKNREIGDYEYSERIDEDSAKRDVEDAENIIKSIESYLQEFLEVKK